jgi:DNA repair and recombination protein RAD52
MPQPTTKREDKLHIKTEPQTPQGETPITYVPRHLRQEIAAAQQSPSTPTHKDPARTSTSGSRTTDTPPNRGPQSLGVQKLAGLNTPIQTPPGRPPIQSHAQYRQAERHPIAREPPTERKVSFAGVPHQANAADDSQADLPGVGVGDGEDSFHINSEDDAFLAAVDLGEGDLGRPIDFEEGLGSVDTLNDSMIGGEQEEMRSNVAAQSPIIQPAPAQAHGRASSGPSSGGSSDSHRGVGRGVSLANAWNGLQSNARSSNSSTGQHTPQFRNGQVNSVSTSSTVAVSLSVSSAAGPSAQDTKRSGGMSMGGLNLPPGMVNNYPCGLANLTLTRMRIRNPHFNSRWLSL